MKLYFLTPTEHLANMVAEVENQLVSPAEFCQRWLEITKVKFGDRKQCDRLLAKVLGVSSSTLRDWGEAPAYPQMPKSHRRNLTHYHHRLLERFSDLQG